MKRNNKLLLGLLVATMLVTVFSHFKWEYQGAFRYVMFTVWAITFSYTALIRRKLLITDFGKLYTISTVLVTIYCVCMMTMGYHEYSENLMLNYMPISCFVYWLGVLLASKDIEHKQIRTMIGSYFIACVIFAVLMRFIQFRNLSSWLTSNVYTYGTGKNQVGMILACAVLCGAFYLLPNYTNRLFRGAIGVGLAVCLFGIALVQCRTAIIAIAFASAYMIYVRGHIKIRYIVIGLMGIILALTNDTIWHYIDHIFFISKYAGRGTDAFLSGRLGYYSEALSIIKRHLLEGVGDYYVDCLYLQLLSEGGIIEALIVYPVVIKRLKSSLKNRENGYTLYNLGAVLMIYYFVTSFLEAQTPFGPGTTACVFWIVSAYGDVNRKQIHKSVE